MSGNRESRIFSSEHVDRFSGNFRLSPKKEQTVILLNRMPNQFRNQIRSRNALRQSIAQQPRYPKQRRSITEHKIRIDEDSAQFDIY